MTKKGKIALSSCLICGTIVTSTLLLTSCSATHNFVKPSPINLNNSFSKIKNIFNDYLNNLNTMTNFNDIFKYENELINIFNSEKFDFRNSVIDVKIDISPIFKNSKLIYSMKYIISFRFGTEIKFKPTENYQFQDNKLISKTFSITNNLLNQQQDSISLWINNANVIQGSAYSAIQTEKDSFYFIYNDNDYNIELKKQINTSLTNFNSINIFINNVIDDTFGDEWFSVIDETPKEINKHTVNVNIKYLHKSLNELSSKPISTTNYNFKITAQQQSY